MHIRVQIDKSKIKLFFFFFKFGIIEFKLIKSRTLKRIIYYILYYYKRIIKFQKKKNTRKLYDLRAKNIIR